MEAKKRLIRSARVLEMLGGVSQVTLWKYVRDGKFPAPIKIGATRYWDETEVDEWFERATSRKSA